jgi:hypothetical protein
MLEKCISDSGGNYLFCDTDSAAIVSSKQRQEIAMPDGTSITALSWAEVQHIVDRFQSLNPYDPKLVPGSILKIHKLNWDRDKKRRQLFGYSIAAKRYGIYTKGQNDIQLVEPKAHGLGYFYPPKDSPEGWKHETPQWIFEAWDWIMRGVLGLKRENPAWFDLPVMMKLTLSTPHHALRNIAKTPLTRPHNFMMLPQISRFGYPQDVDPNKFTLITSFSSDRDQWMKSKCINIHDSQSPVYELTDEYDGRKALAKNFFMLLDSYQNHPEAKSLGPDGKPCDSETRGLLQRAHIVANSPLVYIGKESDKHWEEAPRNQSAHARENLSARACSSAEICEMPEGARRIRSDRRRSILLNHDLGRLYDRGHRVTRLKLQLVRAASSNCTLNQVIADPYNDVSHYCAQYHFLYRAFEPIPS